MNNDNHFIATGTICTDPDITKFEKVSVARFAFAIQIPYKDANGTENINSAIIRAEAWRKTGNTHFFDNIIKGKEITLEGELLPDVFLNKKTNKMESKIVLNAIKIYPKNAA